MFTINCYPLAIQQKNISCSVTFEKQCEESIDIPVTDHSIQKLVEHHAELNLSSVYVTLRGDLIKQKKEQSNEEYREPEDNLIADRVEDSDVNFERTKVALVQKVLNRKLGKRLERLVAKKNTFRFYKEINYGFQNIMLLAPTDNEDEDYYLFDEFSLRIKKGVFTDDYCLELFHVRRHRFLKMSLSNYLVEQGGAIDDISKMAIVGKGLIHKNEVINEINQVSEKCYPMLNKDIARHLNLPLYESGSRNTYKQKQALIDRCLHALKESGLFSDYFQLKSLKPLKLDVSQVGRIHPSYNKMVFGKGEQNEVVSRGLLSGGCHTTTKGSAVIHIVAPQKLERLANKAVNLLKGNYPANSYSVSFSRTTNILLAEQPEVHVADTQEEIVSVAQNIKRNRKEPVLLILINPLGAEEETEADVQNHYRTKEKLLHCKVASQMIRAETLTNQGSIGYYRTGIFSAMAAKLGAVPWVLKNNTHEQDLVIGFGAHKSRSLDRRYVGSAFSFTGSGFFQQFECMEESEISDLVNAFRKFILKNKSELKDINRIVIHFYKQLKKVDIQVFERMLYKLDMDVPVVIMHIPKSPLQMYHMVETGYSTGLPENGRYLKTGYRTYLLWINNRIKPGKQDRKHPRPLKVHFKSSDQTYLTEKRMEELLSQLYGFSNLNWASYVQGTNKFPVSIWYSTKMATKLPYFESRKLVGFATENMWFL